MSTVQEFSSNYANANDLPSWLNAENFQGVVQQTLAEFKNITQFTIKALSSTHDLYRITVQAILNDGKSKSVVYILKTTSRTKEENLLCIFEKERTVYYNIFPALEELYRSAGKVLKFSASSYILKAKSKNDYVLLDDAQSKGYRYANRFEGFDRTHTKVVLEKLAALHAASAVLYERNGAFPKIYTQPLLLKEKALKFTERNASSNRKFAESLRSYNLYEFEDTIKDYQQRFTQNFCKVDKLDSNEFNVLLHGDCCFNNILFQYDAFGNIKDTLFLEFQMCQYGSPAKDLIFLLLSSTRLSEKLNLFDYFIKFYHDHLINNLRLLKYPKALPQLSDLHLAILKYSFYGYVAITKILPVLLLETTSNEYNYNVGGIMNQITEDRETLKNLYKNSNYAKHIELLMPWMENRGFLEE